MVVTSVGLPFFSLCNIPVSSNFSFLKCLFVCLFVCFERERESSNGGEVEREKGRERIPSRLHFSMESDVGLDPTAMRSWPGPKSSQMLNQLSHPGVLLVIFLTQKSTLFDIKTASPAFFKLIFTRYILLKLLLLTCLYYI